MFNTSITMGAHPRTRGSAAAVSHVVQPRFEAPVRKKRSTFFESFSAVNACTASIPRIAARVMGRSAGQVSSFVSRYCLKV